MAKSNSNLLCIEGAVVSLTEGATRSTVSRGHGLQITSWMTFVFLINWNQKAGHLTIHLRM